ncbi:type ISP restriction/modification enzyme [Maribacter hydrothermalis]|uniref:Type ISP restriction-modification enzyme LLaBIII C-terminal specificity domain-containing protein n=1 Tax=Maribacter hydrothermalis TaxID=1836467 RepID=A0A1B7ZFE7_9FLAO|nr:type ISP restriction/modification enzyme [Maribacter hydrothermalis]APQ17780.1 hypothetical protein BTR34_10760 [Maribacter hydrothermalis]OBR42254.1 hypothetical protein A9200_02380 [Maribacter hydrothermalis]
MTLAHFLEKTSRRILNFNLDPKILKEIEVSLGLLFLAEAEEGGNVCMINSPEVRYAYKDTFTSIDLLNYIYAIQLAPWYSDKYKEFLDINFPKVPYPTDQNVFWQMVQLGGELRQLHWLESPKITEYITSFPVDGNNRVERKFTSSSPGFEPSKSLDHQHCQRGKVWINNTQYFDHVPLTAWKIYLGVHQPAQKWLKDRSGRILDFEEILQYHKIIVALTETHRFMQVINTIKID